MTVQGPSVRDDVQETPAPFDSAERIGLASAMTKVEVRRLAWDDAPLGTIPMPKRALELRSGFGSGLARRQGDPPGVVWAICDRGPNLKLKDARKLYGWEPPAEVERPKDAKMMPRLDLGPAIAQLRVTEDSVALVREIRLADAGGRPVPGLPVPGEHARHEPALGLDGAPLAPDPSGMDTEGLAATRDGRFWAGEEYGPSLVRIGADGRVQRRLVPEGAALPGADQGVEARLPAIAARRQLNRGFEAVAVSPSEEKLFLAFQSPLAHPDKAAHEAAAHVRIWRLDAQGRAEAQFLYRLDEPESFRRDAEKGKVERSDLKVCELAALSEQRLLVLERASETTKIYRVDLDPSLQLGDEHWDAATRPTVEEISASGAALAELPKRLVFDSGDHLETASDMEGMVALDARSLLLVSDNDFGVEGKATKFYRLEFERPLSEI